MTPEIQRSLNKLALSIALASLWALVVFVGLFYLIQRNSYLEKSKLVSDIVRNSILTSDFRQTVSIMSAYRDESLRSIRLTGADIQGNIEVPAASQSSGFFDLEIRVPILSNLANSNSEVANIQFIFSMRNVILIPLAIWAAFAGMAVVMFRSVKSSIIRKHLEEIDFGKQQELANLAAQVAHDIRSPLSALRIAQSLATEPNPKIRELTQNALDRIDSIAKDLLAKRKDTNFSATARDLATVLTIPIEECRLRFNGPSTDFEASIDPACEGFLIRDSAKLMRVISNLLNNAFESLAISDGKKNFVRVSGRVSSEGAVIEIEDSGRGMSARDLRLLTKGKLLSLKPNSNGIGFKSGMASISEMGGHLKVRSELDRGTKITILIPPVSTKM